MNERYRCPRCTERGTLPSFASEPKCAFAPTGVFVADNWQCATMNALREIARDTKIMWTCDQHAALLPLEGGFIVLGWYKDRGRTEYAGYLQDYVCGPLTLRTAEAYLSAAKEA